jgi:predicted nucleic acid-binding protein
LAGKLNLTFYDAVYLAAAQKLGSILITEDERLRKAAKKAETATKRVLEIRE